MTSRMPVRTAKADAPWCAIYAAYAPEYQEPASALTARAEARALRLSLIYDLLDGSAVSTSVHLQAAIEVSAYANRSVTDKFGEASGDPIADAIERPFARTAN